MTLPEATKFLLKIKTIYPKFYSDQTTEEILMGAEIWGDLLHDITMEEANIYLKRYASTNKFPPSPADIRDERLKVTNRFLTEGEAWEMAMKLTKVNWYGPGVAHEMDYLNADELVIKAWKNIGMSNIAMSENIAIERSNFLRIYNTLISRELKEKTLPKNLQIEVLRKKYLQKNEPKQLESN